MAQGTDGNLYGTLPRGGASGYGTVYKITPAGTLTAIYNFSGPDGVYPSEGLTLGTDGNFYGTTTGDGANIYANNFQDHAIGNADHTSQFYWSGIRTKPAGVGQERILRGYGCSAYDHVLGRFQTSAESSSQQLVRGPLRQVGRVVATLTGETVSAQTVSSITRSLDEVVRQFHQARLNDDYAYLFLDGVSLRMRRPAGRKRCTCW